MRPDPSTAPRAPIRGRATRRAPVRSRLPGRRRRRARLASSLAPFLAVVALALALAGLASTPPTDPRPPAASPDRPTGPADRIPSGWVAVALPTDTVLPPLAPGDEVDLWAPADAATAAADPFGPPATEDPRHARLLARGARVIAGGPDPGTGRDPQDDRADRVGGSGTTGGAFGGTVTDRPLTVAIRAEDAATVAAGLAGGRLVVALTGTGARPGRDWPD